MSRETPEQVLKSIVDGINTGNLDALMTLYEPEAPLRSAWEPRSRLAGFVNHWPLSCHEGYTRSQSDTRP